MSIFNLIEQKIINQVFWRLPMYSRFSLGDGVKRKWRCYEYVRKHLKWCNIENNQIEGKKENVRINKTVFVYWRQGIENAPEIVKLCLKSIHRHTQGYDICILTLANINDYIFLPEHIWEMYNSGYIKDAHFSDLIRNQLLLTYGGIWCDATCYWSAEMPVIVSKSPFFMFNRDLLSGRISPIECSNWFIKAEKGNCLLCKLQNFLFEYYKHNHYLINYFLFHIVLSVLVNEDKSCKEIWDNKPYVCNMNPHILQFNFAHEYDNELYQFILSSSFIHKLTYKYNHRIIDDSNSILKHLLSETE